jgi:SAM-dependent methyltransferase
MAEFDHHVDHYRDEVQTSISFSGQEVAFFHRRKAEVLVELANRLVGDPGQLSALDVGCGVGSIDHFLAGRFGRLCGVDTAPVALGRGARENPEVTYLAADGGQLPFPTGAFDVAFAVCVLHHVPPPYRVEFGRELRRVVRDGGLVVVFEHNALNPLTRLAVSRCEFDEGVELLTRGASTRVLSGAGLTPVEARDVIFTPFDHRLARRLDQALGRVPLGAQHYVAAYQRPGPAPASGLPAG